MSTPRLFLGRSSTEAGDDATEFLLDADRLRTHGVVVGMTGSGKTGLSLVLLEELIRGGVPVIAIDPKGDLGSLGLLFEGLASSEFAPWVEGGAAEQTAQRWKNGLARWGLGPEEVDALRARMDLRLYTPGSGAGLGIDIFGAFRRPSADVLADDDARRQLVTATVSGLLGLTGRSIDPVRDPAHVVLSRIVDEAWCAGHDPDLESLVLALVDPPFEKVGVFPIDRFFPPKERMDLAMELNAVLASPAFAAWRQGDALDIERMLVRPDQNGGRVPVSVLNIAHLGEEQRRFLLSVVLGRLQAWSRRQPGTEGLRALVYFDEVAGYLPPHPANPPTKAPLLTLMKQARAVGVGVVLCTQNPVDLDYKALSNAGTWMIGRLQTAQDRSRLLKGIGRQDLDETVQGLAKRHFVVHVAGKGTAVIGSRHAMCYLRGPLTGVEIQRIVSAQETATASTPAAVSSNHPSPPGAPATPMTPPPLPTGGNPSPSSVASVPPPLPTGARTIAPPVVSPPPLPVYRHSAHPTPPPLPSPTPPPVPLSRATPPPPPAVASPVDDGLLPAPPATPGPSLWLDPMVAHSARLAGAFPLEPTRADRAIVWRPALHLEVRLRFDEDRVGFVLDEHHHRVWFPLDAHRMPEEPHTLALDARELLPTAPAAPARYAMLPGWCDEARELKSIQKRICDEIYRSESRGMYIHRKLKLHGRSDESEAEFRARCEAAAEDCADAEIEKLQDRVAKKVARIEEKLARTEQRIIEQEGVVQGRKTEEMVGLGETVLSFFVGRRRSLSSAVGRRSRTQRSAQHLAGMEAQLARLQDEAVELEASLAEEIDEIRSRWADVAVEGVESKPVRLERNDIGVVRFGVLWIPVTRSF